MKIAVPVNEDKSSVCISFGRTPLFALADSETGEISFFDNSAASSSGGAGIKAAQSLLDMGAAAVLTPRCGENAAEVLKAGGAKVYRTRGDSLKENIEAFHAGELAELEEIHPGFHNHGGGR